MKSPENFIKVGNEMIGYILPHAVAVLVGRGPDTDGEDPETTVYDTDAPERK